ncbi:3-hydroxyacyl-ACP dehydratase FabZ family protein [uncultured Bradyrhizobium sp.]|uniref:3-hydroxyacyl-ACP dehydratase FabZ family protein n=1 Tax=uncultured Bradyrhizobium sp. TaxID=199684 RepID=UPI0035CC9A32
MTKVATTVQKAGADSLVVTEPTRYLSHRPPFLFVDHAEVNPDMSEARGVRRFLAEDWFFKGHFPGDPIVPGVILLEVAAQTANLLLSCRADRLVHGYLVNADTVSFKTPVRSGDTVTASVRFSRAEDAGTEIKPGSFFTFKTSVLRENQPCMRALLSVFWAK